MLISNKKVPNRKPLYLTILKLFLVVALLSFAFSYKGEFLEILDNVYESTASRYLEKLTVKQINVTGHSKLSSEDIIKISAIHLGEATLKADVVKAKEYLEGQGWIESASVSRVYPYTINIAIQEESPVAIWWDGQGFNLIGKNGKIIEKIPDPVERPKHILLFGSAAPSSYNKIYKQIFNTEIFNSVVAASNIAGRRWDIYLDGAILIKLPEINVDRALILLDNLHKNGIIEANGLKELDMRLSPEKIFVKKK